MVRPFRVANHLSLNPLSDEEILKRLIEDTYKHDASVLSGTSVSPSIRVIAYTVDLKPIPQGHRSLGTLLPKVLAATGQKFIVLALVFLTALSKYLPPSVAKLLNDKLVATLYEMMPRNPTDLTGAVIDLPPDMMGRPNQPYARSVPVEGSASLADLPDPNDVFDKLLKRSETEDWESISFFPSFFFFFFPHQIS